MKAGSSRQIGDDRLSSRLLGTAQTGNSFQSPSDSQGMISSFGCGYDLSSRKFYRERLESRGREKVSDSAQESTGNDSGTKSKPVSITAESAYDKDPQCCGSFE